MGLGYPGGPVIELLAREGHDVVVTRGSTYENRANLAPGFLGQIIRKYEGTRLGRQELDAELLEDTPGALWTHALIDANRLSAAPEMTRIVVAIRLMGPLDDAQRARLLEIAGKCPVNRTLSGRIEIVETLA